jgi:hypothetical protein
LQKFSSIRKGFPALDFGLIFFSNATIFFHISYTDYLKDSLDFLSSFAEPRKPFLFEGSDDDIVTDDEGLLYDFFNHDDVYVSSIQAWIEEYYVGFFPSSHDFGVLGHLYEHISYFIPYLFQHVST